MSADEFSDFTKDDVIELMVEGGATKDVATAKTTEQAIQLDAALKKLAQHSFNNIPAAGPRVVVGHFHFKLRKAITNSIKISSGLLTASISLVAFPVVPMAALGVVAGAASAVVTAIDTISDMFTRMTDEELYVYESILDIARNNLDIAKNLTADLLKDWFRKHQEAPPNHLDAILAAMEKKGVLKKTGYDNEAKYSIVQ